MLNPESWAGAIPLYCAQMQRLKIVWFSQIWGRGNHCNITTESDTIHPAVHRTPCYVCPNMCIMLQLRKWPKLSVVPGNMG